MTTHKSFRQISIISQEIIVTVIFTILFSPNCIPTSQHVQLYKPIFILLFHFFSKKYPADNSLSQYESFFLCVVFLVRFSFSVLPGNVVR